MWQKRCNFSMWHEKPEEEIIDNSMKRCYCWRNFNWFSCNRLNGSSLSETFAFKFDFKWINFKLSLTKGMEIKIKQKFVKSRNLPRIKFEKGFPTSSLDELFWTFLSFWAFLSFFKPFWAFLSLRLLVGSPLVKNSLIFCQQISFLPSHPRQLIAKQLIFVIKTKTDRLQ